MYLKRNVIKKWKKEVLTTANKILVHAADLISTDERLHCKLLALVPVYTQQVHYIKCFFIQHLFYVVRTLAADMTQWLR